MYDYDANPIACAPFMPLYPSKPVAAISAGWGSPTYWGAPGNRFSLSPVTGNVGPMLTTNGKQKFKVNLQNLDTRCTCPYNHAGCRASGVSCAMDIVKENTCKTGKGNNQPEPNVLARAFYTATPDGDSVGGPYEVTLGLTQLELIDNGVILYDFDGERVACATLENLVCPAGCRPDYAVGDILGDLPFDFADRARSLLFSGPTPGPGPVPDDCPTACKAL